MVKRDGVILEKTYGLREDWWVFEKNISLMVKKSLLVFLKKTKKHYYVKKKQI